MSMDLDNLLPPPGQNYENGPPLVFNPKTGKPVGEDTAVGGETSVGKVSGPQGNLPKDTIDDSGGKSQGAQADIDPANPQAVVSDKYEKFFNALAGGTTFGVALSDSGLEADYAAYVESQGKTDAPSSLGATSVQSSGVGETPPPTTTSGNPWLQGNAYVAFMVNFMELAKMLMENTAVDAQSELNGLTMTLEMGKLTAKAIVDAGLKARDMHRMAGTMAAVSAATTAVTTAISIGSALKNSAKPEIDTPEPITSREPPQLNKGPPLKDPTGAEVQVQVPKYVQYKGQVFRNEPPPVQAGLPDAQGRVYDPAGKPYLPQGQTSIDISKPSAQTAGVTAITEPNLRQSLPPAELNATIRTASYNQYEVRPGVGAGPASRVKPKEEIAHENEQRAANIVSTGGITRGVNEFVSNLTKSIEEFTKAKLELQKSELEAHKEMMSTIARMLSHGLDKATEAIKTNQDQFAQVIQQLDSIRAKLHEAINASLKK